MKNMRGRMMRKEAVRIGGNAEESYNSNRNMARSSSVNVNTSANLLFLPEPSLLLENLTMDGNDESVVNTPGGEAASAVFSVSVDKLRGGKDGSRCFVSVVCLNKHGHSSAVSVYLPRTHSSDEGSVYLDSRLYPSTEELDSSHRQIRNFKIPPPLDPEKHYVERCAISCVHPRALVQSDPKKQLPTKLLASDGKSGGGTFVFASSGSGDDFNAFDTLEKVRGPCEVLYARGVLAKPLMLFRFCGRLVGGNLYCKKRENATQHSHATSSTCFLPQGPDFFSDVVAPYISDKPEPTFMDAFLLGRDVSRWKRPAEMSQLNALETALLLVNGGIAKGSEQAKSFANRLRQQARG